MGYDGRVGYFGSYVLTTAPTDVATADVRRDASRQIRAAEEEDKRRPSNVVTDNPLVGGSKSHLKMGGTVCGEASGLQQRAERAQL